MENEKRLVGYDPKAFGEFATSIIEKCEAYNTYDDGYVDGVERIEDWLEFNTAEAELVVHAHWVDRPDGAYRICSNCRCGIPAMQRPLAWIRCPVCGAHMDEEVADEKRKAAD